MNLSYQELNKKVVDDALKSEGRICIECGLEYGTKDDSYDVKVRKGNCAICEDMTFVYESHAFFDR